MLYCKLSLPDERNGRRCPASLSFAAGSLPVNELPYCNDGPFSFLHGYCCVAAFMLPTPQSTFTEIPGPRCSGCWISTTRSITRSTTSPMKLAGITQTNCSRAAWRGMCVLCLRPAIVSGMNHRVYVKAPKQTAHYSVPGDSEQRTTCDTHVSLTAAQSVSFER